MEEEKKLLEIAWNGEKIDRKLFLKFLTFFFFLSWKNQSCLKLPDLARKLIEKFFEIFDNFFFFLQVWEGGRSALWGSPRSRTSRAQGR